MQRKLNPLDAQYKPGRLPDDEKSLQGLLSAHFSESEREKIRSKRADWQNLRTLVAGVLATEKKFDGSNIDPRKRRNLRAELEYRYDVLVDQAARYLDQANREYDDALTTEARKIRSAHPTVNELFKGGQPWIAAKPNIDIPARVAKFISREQYAEAVRSRYKKLYKPSGGGLVSTLSGSEQAALAAEKLAVTTQLGAWANKTYDAEGCNGNGTWGTSKGGAGPGFSVSTVNTKVWAELKIWWHAKVNTYVALSDSSRYSLKKFRDVGGTDRSATFNYHIKVA